MTSHPSSITIVGCSLAGLSAARSLRDDGYAGAITMIGDESHMPYNRPPLSKHYLAGDCPDAELDFPGETGPLNVNWRLGQRAVSLDLEARRVSLESGDEVPYGGLVIATGAVPHHLPIADLAGVHVLRTLADAKRLRADLDRKPARVAIIGGGFIGGEVAATCRLRGLEVTMIEALAMPLGRAVGDEIGAVIADLHRQRGVDLRCGVTVCGFHADSQGRIRRLLLSNGASIDTTVVVLCVGVAPCTSWLEGSGLTIDNGVVCDATCLAAPNVVAAGDVARFPNSRYGENRRIEHWDNAIRMGRHAARRLLAGDEMNSETYAPLPWVWSDQYDRKIQIFGSTVDRDEVCIVEGNVAQHRLIAIYRRGSRLTAVIGINMARSLRGYRELLERNGSFDDALQLAAKCVTDTRSLSNESSG